MTFPFRPLAHRIVVKLDPKETASPNGLIYIPELFQEQATTGEVVAVGPGEWDPKLSKRVPLGIEVGQTVVVGKYNGIKITREQLSGRVPDDGYEYWILDNPRDGRNGHGVQDTYLVIEQ